MRPRYTGCQRRGSSSSARARGLLQRSPGRSWMSAMLDEGELHPPGASRVEGETGPAAWGTWGSLAGAVLARQRGEMRADGLGTAGRLSRGRHAGILLLAVSVGGCRSYEYRTPHRRGPVEPLCRAVPAPRIAQSNEPCAVAAAAQGTCPGGPSAPSARHRAWPLGTGGTSRRGDSQKKFCPPFLRRIDSRRLHATGSDRK